MMSDDFALPQLLERLETLAVRDNSSSLSLNRATATMNAIKSLILRDNLVPGDPLPTEAVLEKELGVSRSSVREAIRKLEALDIVEVRHGSGTFVGQMSLQPMTQTLALRASLSAAGNLHFLKEVADTRLTLDHGMAQAVISTYKGKPDSKLNAIVDDMIAHAKEGIGFMAEDMAFHDRLIRGLGNELTRQTYSSLWMVHSAILPDLVTETAGMALPTAQAHRKMLEAAYEGDVGAYHRAVDEHYAPLMKSLASLT